MRKLVDAGCNMNFGSGKLKVTRGALVVDRETIHGAFSIFQTNVFLHEVNLNSTQLDLYTDYLVEKQHSGGICGSIVVEDV